MSKNLTQSLCRVKLRNLLIRIDIGHFVKTGLSDGRERASVYLTSPVIVAARSPEERLVSRVFDLSNVFAISRLTVSDVSMSSRVSKWYDICSNPTGN